MITLRNEPITKYAVLRAAMLEDNKNADDIARNTSFTLDRIQKILAYKATHYAECNCTPSEREEIKIVWDKLPGNTCLWDAFYKIAHVKGYWD